jgi:Tfp pilus assembly protein PilF
MPEPPARGTRAPVPQQHGPQAGAPPPEIVALQHKAGALFQAGRLPDALTVCRQILALQPARADVHAFAGMIALRLGDRATAVEHYSAAITHDPQFFEAHYNLGRALQQQGETEAAVTAYQSAIAIKPNLAPAHHNLGNALMALGRHAEAAEAYARTLVFAPDAADSQRNLGLALQKLERHDEAEEAFRAVLTARPDWNEAHNNLTDTLLAKGDAAGAVEAAAAWLAALPGSVAAMSYHCVALNELGDKARLHYWLDFDGLVRTRRYAEIPGYESLDAFNAALVAHVRNHPTLKVPPESDPTYHHPSLWITEELLDGDKGPMETLEAIILEAIADYRATVDVPPDHPFLAQWPERWHLTAWGVVLEGEGNLAPHLHLEGYMGGCYYPQLPDVVADEQAKGGWFQLGRPPDAMPLKAKHETSEIRPYEGLMVLFPGYYYHATVPFKSPQRRVSIAFDVVAED